MKYIASIQNPYIKSLVTIQEKSRERKKTGHFVIEGMREIELALKGGYEIVTILFCSGLCTKEELNKNIHITSNQNYNSIDFIEISKEVYQKLAYRSTTEGVLAMAKIKELNLYDLSLREKSLILVVEAPEKPGNIGALLRTADAANVDAVIIANPKTDLYNPNTIRSSVGCLFTNQIATGTSQEIISYLKGKNINFFCACLQDSIPYYKADFTTSTAIIIGTEDKGLSKEWRENSEKNIIIPMQGKIDSMNLSVAAAILIFEAKRQRDFL